MRFQVLALVCLINVSNVAPVWATGGPESTAKLFVPGNHVPLSDFKKKLSNGSVTLTVDPRIMSWISEPEQAGGTLYVALRKASGQVHYYLPTSAPTSNSVTLTYPGNSQTGDCVVVFDLLRHDPNIVTHWNASWDENRGRQEVGAHDGFSNWDYAYDAQATEKHTLTNILAIPIVNSNPSWAYDAEHVYYYASDDRALFSDGSGHHDDDAVPSYEVYIGENYSLNAYTDRAAIWLSDRARQLTGFPAAHRNHPDAFTSTTEGHHVQDDLPLFQIVHGHLVAPSDSDPTDGNEQSIATFILPPLWSSTDPAGPYPVLFNGYYDLNGNTFSENEGLSFFRTLGTLYDQSRKVVGILWNGGGANACQTFQRSAYDNADQLFDDAENLINADKHTMVFTGGSRGGTTALEMASNPYPHDYTAKLVQARAPQVLVGTMVTKFVNPSYPDTMSVIDSYTGYMNSWISLWMEPVTSKTFQQVMLRNFFGTEDPMTVDNQLSLDSDPFRSALVAAGTGVVLRIGTHDANESGVLLARYVNHLRAETPVPLLAQYFYRFGHKIPFKEPDGVTLLQPDDAALVNMAVIGAVPFSQIEHFQTDPDDYTLQHEIFPDHIPLTAELPATAGTSQPQTWSFVGEPGANVRVRVAPLNSYCRMNGTITGPELEYPVTLLAGVGDELGTAAVDPTIELGDFEGALECNSTWKFEVDYDWNDDGVWDITLGDGDISLPPIEPLPAGYELAQFCICLTESKGLPVGERTNGVSEDGHFTP